MAAIPNHFETLMSQAGDYAETRANIIKLKIADKTSDTLSDAASAFVVWLFICFFILIFSVGLALWLGEWLGKTYYGFFIVGGFYGIAGIIFHLNRKSFIKNPVSRFLIAKILKTPE